MKPAKTHLPRSIQMTRMIAQHIHNNGRFPNIECPKRQHEVWMIQELLTKGNDKVENCAILWTNPYSFCVPKVSKSTTGNRVESKLVGFPILVYTIRNHTNRLPLSIWDFPCFIRLSNPTIKCKNNPIIYSQLLKNYKRKKKKENPSIIKRDKHSKEADPQWWIPCARSLLEHRLQ